MGATGPDRPRRGVGVRPHRGVVLGRGPHPWDLPGHAPAAGPRGYHRRGDVLARAAPRGHVVRAGGPRAEPRSPRHQRRRLQRVRRAVRPPGRRGGLRRHPQRHVGRGREGLDVHSAERRAGRPSSTVGSAPSCSTSTTAGRSRTWSGPRLLSQSEQELSKAAAHSQGAEGRRRASSRWPGRRYPEGPTVYLCHIYCELGATLAKHGVPAPARLPPGEPQRGGDPDPRGLRDGRGRHRRARVERSGRPRLHLGARCSGADAASAHRAQEERPGDGRAQRRGHRSSPWYLPAYDGLLQETTYKFDSIDELSSPAFVPARARRHARPAPAAEPLARHRTCPIPNDGTKANVRLRARRSGPTPAAAPATTSRTSSPSTCTPRATCSRWSTASTASR